jgi:hypothetical protein
VQQSVCICIIKVSSEIGVITFVRSMFCLPSVGGVVNTWQQRQLLSQLSTELILWNMMFFHEIKCSSGCIENTLLPLTRFNRLMLGTHRYTVWAGCTHIVCLWGHVVPWVGHLTEESSCIFNEINSYRTCWKLNVVTLWWCENDLPSYLMIMNS